MQSRQSAIVHRLSIIGVRSGAFIIAKRRSIDMNQPWFKSYEPLVPHTLEYPDITLDSFLTESARKYPYNTASNFVLSYLAGGRFTVGGKLTYRKLNELADRFATALYQLGVRKGDRVALMLLNLFWPRLREIQEETPIKRVIVANIFDTLGFPSNLLVKAKQRKDPAWVEVRPEHDIFFFQHLLDKYGPTPPKADTTPDDVALFQYTGGTTGLPKAAMLTHRNMVHNTIQMGSWVTDKKLGAEKMMAAIPFFHVYGMTACMIFSISMGAEMVIVPNPRPIDNVMNIIQKERCTLFPGVPAMYIGIVNHPKIGEYDLKSVRACFSGSAPLPMEIQERFGTLTGGRLVEAYGLTETSPGTHANPVYGTRKSGSIGIPFPDTEAKIIDLETGADLPIGGEQQGELCVRGRQVMKGYWNRPEETAETIDADGWLHTGDICKTDAD